MTRTSLRSAFAADVDTVAVSYVLHPLGEYVGPTSKHRLTTVEFVGGPGIP